MTRMPHHTDLIDIVAIGLAVAFVFGFAANKLKLSPLVGYLFAGMLVDAYQAASVNVQVSDLRAAVERHNPDDSVDVLVAVRVKVTNSAAADQEQGYRLRVNMARADGTYKVSTLEQVTS